ncbi:acyltransferase [Parapedobacter lycopersici]|uniref:acyltransferase family protein n=1 Tax=Parapedobacter lycopersici TaxID=1864939 RepID=UPI0033402224
MTRNHFVVLDGLRGIAAIAVVIFHFMEWIIPDFSDNFIGHGYLAVDFFFCLSGFVIGYAYDEKIKAIGFWNFVKARLVRLHPLVVIGSVLGLLGFLFPLFGEADHYSFSSVLILFLSSVFLIPYPVLESRAFNLFSLNAPSWSLFWEYIVNIAYAVWLSKIHRKTLTVFLCVSAVWLVYTSYHYGNLLGGWSKDNWEAGAARVSYSFGAGLFIYRNRWIIQNRGGFMLSAAFLLMCLLMPFFSPNWLIDGLIVLFVFPFIVSLGAGTSVEPAFSQLANWLGNISYPLYMTHYWAIWFFGAYLSHPAYTPDQLAYIIPTGTLFLIGFAHVVMKFLDMPIRVYLKKKLAIR